MAAKILGQDRPAAATTGTVYQVPVGKSAVVSSIVICNTDPANADEFILYQILAAGSPGADNTIFLGEIPAKDSFVVVAGITLEEGESIRMYSTNGRMTITVNGDEA